MCFCDKAVGVILYQQNSAHLRLLQVLASSPLKLLATDQQLSRTRLKKNVPNQTCFNNDAIKFSLSNETALISTQCVRCLLCISKMTIKHDRLPLASLASRTKQNQEINQGGKSGNAMKEIIAMKRDNRLGEAAKQKKIRIEEEKVLLKQKMDSKHAAHKNNIEARNKRTRQEHLMRIIVMSAAIPTCLRYVAEESVRRNQSLLRNSAATIVQTYYHERFIQRVIANARKIQNKLQKLRWRMILWVRTTKRRRHAQVVRQFFIDFAALQMEYVVYRFRKRVLQSQCLIKRFMECQQARRIALFNLWEKLEPDVAKAFRQRKRKVLLNAKHPLRVSTNAADFI